MAASLIVVKQGTARSGIEGQRPRKVSATAVSDPTTPSALQVSFLALERSSPWDVLGLCYWPLRRRRWSSSGTSSSRSAPTISSMMQWVRSDQSSVRPTPAAAARRSRRAKQELLAPYVAAQGCQARQQVRQHGKGPTDPFPTQPGSRSPKLPIASMYSSMW